MDNKQQGQGPLPGAGQSAVAAHLLQKMEKIKVIDCHSHLPSEEVFLKSPADLFTGLIAHVSLELKLAGMPDGAVASLFDTALPLRERWAVFSPFLPLIWHTTYYETVRKSVKELFGYDDVTSDNYQDISARLAGMHRPGIYQTIFAEKCNIQSVLTNVPTGAQTISSHQGLLLPIPQSPLMALLFAGSGADILHPVFAPQAAISSVDDYIDAATSYMKDAKRAGALGFKMHAAEYTEPDRSAAVALFNEIKQGKPWPAPLVFPMTNFIAPMVRAMPLYSYIMDSLIRFAESEDLVIAAHTGYWSDFRQYNPANMIPLLRRHPGARFDIYHLGYPYVREALMLGKGFSNVWLNFCWAHYISRRFAMDALDEAIDLVPSNKILAFGSDMGLYNVCGHLAIAKENIAQVLARRINANTMNERQAMDLIHNWFWDNPRRLYRLPDEICVA